MSFRYVVVCDVKLCHRQQGIRTAVVQHDGAGVYKSDLPGLGWKEEGGKHTCPFCANPCAECDGEGVVDIERPMGTYIDCRACGGSGIARAQKEKGGN